VRAAACAGARVEVRFRRSGERCRPAGRAHGQSLKRLLQEAGVPPWMRTRIPLLYLDGELAAVADLRVCEPFQAGPGEAGLVLRWRPAPPGAQP
jgi:tRNA(Ile)-lysidine synthase